MIIPASAGASGKTQTIAGCSYVATSTQFPVHINYRTLHDPEEIAEALNLFSQRKI